MQILQSKSNCNMICLTLMQALCVWQHTSKDTWSVKGKFDSRPARSSLASGELQLIIFWEVHLSSSEMLYLWISSHSHSKIKCLDSRLFFCILCNRGGCILKPISEWCFYTMTDCEWVNNSKNGVRKNKASFCKYFKIFEKKKTQTKNTPVTPCLSCLIAASKCDKQCLKLVLINHQKDEW